MHNESKVLIENDVMLKNNDEVTLHFTYDDPLTLKELSELLDLSNKAINDLNRDNGVKGPSKFSNEYASKVTAVKEGSIEIDLMVSLVLPTVSSVIAGCIQERLKTWKKSKKKNEENNQGKYPHSIIVNGGNVNIHIHNHNS